MDQLIVLILVLFLLAALLTAIVLPIVAIVISVNTRRRIAQLEAALAGRPIVAEPAQEPQPPPPSLEPVAPPPPPIAPEPPPASSLSAFDLESIIGRRWIGWIAVLLILFATAFFLKYAFDNRWIGELGRVSIGIAFGIGMCLSGFRYQQRGWRIFSQILTAGGIVLLYLSN